MNDTKRDELEIYLLQLQVLADSWSPAERKVRTERLRAELAEREIGIDDELANALEKFACGKAKFEVLFGLFQEKLREKWRRL